MEENKIRCTADAGCKRAPETVDYSTLFECCSDLVEATNRIELNHGILNMVIDRLRAEVETGKENDPEGIFALVLDNLSRLLDETDFLLGNQIDHEDDLESVAKRFAAEINMNL